MSKNLPIKSSKTQIPNSVLEQSTKQKKAEPNQQLNPAANPSSHLPTLDDVINTPGQPLTAEELQNLKKTGSMPPTIHMGMNPSLHKVKSGNEEYLVMMVDAPPCGCRKVNGKKERCRNHRAQLRNKKKQKKGLKDDDSDRKKLGALRHAEDSEEDDTAINGAITVDAICIVGPCGAAVLVPIDVKDNPNAGPRAPIDMKDVKGILVKGPEDCPQFIPYDKVPRDEKGQPKYTHFTVGTLVRKLNGEHVFYPDGGCKWDDKGCPIDMKISGVDSKFVQEVGGKIHIAGVVDVDENGMPVYRQVDAENVAPQDKMATVGVLVNVKGETYFVQTKGQTIGSGDSAPAMATTKDGPQTPGTVLGDAVMNKNGYMEVVPQGQGKGQVVGTIIQGDYNQPILIAKKGGILDKNETVIFEATKAQNMKQSEWNALAQQQQAQLRAAEATIMKNNVLVAAAVTGKTPDQIRKEIAETKANIQGPQEVISQAFNDVYARSTFCYTGGGTGGGEIKGTGRGGITGQGYQYNGGEVRSVSFNYPGGGGAKSVFLTK